MNQRSERERKSTYEHLHYISIALTASLSLWNMLPPTLTMYSTLNTIWKIISPAKTILIFRISVELRHEAIVRRKTWRFGALYEKFILSSSERAKVRRPGTPSKTAENNIIACENFKDISFRTYRAKLWRFDITAKLCDVFTKFFARRLIGRLAFCRIIEFRERGGYFIIFVQRLL